MKPVPSDPAEHLLRVRQQLILSQVRIMELEDLRDELVPKLRAAQQLQATAQQLADAKADLAHHLESVVTAQTAQLAALGEQMAQLHQQLTAAGNQIGEFHAEINRLRSECQRHTDELQAVKKSRSWRWTAWLRAIGL
jgi:septal ring factor EnvC (AmiA/AmiB activator)